MSLRKEVIQKIMGIHERVYLRPTTMARYLKVTFLPPDYSPSKILVNFMNKLKKSLRYWRVKIIPYEKCFDKNNKIKEGIIIFTFPIKGKDLPINYVRSFTSNQIVTVMEDVFWQEENNLKKKIEKATRLFAWHMSNLIIGVNEDTWRIYNFNGSFPTYGYDRNFNKNVLYGLISKLATPIRPLKLSEFIIKKKKKLNIDKKILKDFIVGSQLLNSTRLFPPLIKINKLKFRAPIYRLMASVYLDRRSGLSYGFLARQLPVRLPKVIPKEELKKFNTKFKDIFYILIKINKKEFFIPIPPVWVIITRSGCEKTNLEPNKDLCKIGLYNGKLIWELPQNVDLNDYRPSFDTRVILAHAVSNVIYSAILKYFDPNNYFSRKIEKDGMAIVHWHGYLNKNLLPRGYWIYGEDKPAVSCSSPHTAIYTFQGKFKAIKESLQKKIEYLGDIHVEPQHGVNVNWESIVGLAKFLLSHKNIY